MQPGTTDDFYKFQLHFELDILQIHLNVLSRFCGNASFKKFLRDEIFQFFSITRNFEPFFLMHVLLKSRDFKDFACIHMLMHTHVRIHIHTQ